MLEKPISALPGGGRAGRVPLDSLPQHLGADAEHLLIGVSVYREPADRNAVLFQVGQHDWTAARAPDRRGPAPPYQPPAELDEMLCAAQAAGLLLITPGPASATAAADGHTVFVEPWLASELHRLLTAAGRGAELAAAHQHAAKYWQWRSAAWPQARRADVHDLLEARHHLFDAGDTDQAGALTEAVCAQLHAWGDLGRESALIHETLDRLPARSAARAGWIYELGRIAAVKGDHADAERRYQQALDMFAIVGDRAGVSRSYHSLGVLAQAQGDYGRAERRYQQANDAGEGAAAAGHQADEAAGPVPRQTAAPPVPATLTGPATLTETATSAVTAMPPAPAISRAAVMSFSPPAAGTGVSADRRPAAGAGPGPAMVPVISPRLAAPPRLAARPRPAAGHAHPSRWTSGWWLPGLTAGAVVLAAFAAVQITGIFSSASGARLSSDTAASSAGAVRRQTATWVRHQVARSAVVACDPAMCSALQARGVPAGSLLALGPGGSADPLGSNLVVATAAVRSLFGARLASVYAPLVIASFGRGSSRIEVRVVAPDGSAAYLSAVRSDLLARRQAGAQLLVNRRIVVTAAARRQLIDGSVDSRVLTTLAALAQMRRLRVLSFSSAGRGAASAVPLTIVVLTGAGQRTSIASLHPLLTFLRAQQPPFLAASAQAEQLGDGQGALRMEFAEPGPLGLLTAGQSTLPPTTP